MRALYALTDSAAVFWRRFLLNFAQGHRVHAFLSCRRCTENFNSQHGRTGVLMGGVGLDPQHGLIMTRGAAAVKYDVPHRMEGYCYSGGQRGTL